MSTEQFLSSKAMLAPMSGVSDVAFRRIAARFGASHVVTEMVAADHYLRGAEEARLRSAGAGLGWHVVQLVGRHPGRMADAARLAEAAGAQAIDINMGCPAKRVVGGLGGSALMREPELALGIVAETVRAVSVPVTVKMRLGWDAASLNAAALSRRMAELGARAVAVHGRTRQQFYAGAADWAAIAAVVRDVAIPIVANGDVGSLASARACLAASGAAAVMIGRAAVGQPWLVGEIGAALAGRDHAPPSYGARADAAREHYEALLSFYGVATGTKHARKHLSAYSQVAMGAGFGLSSGERDELVRSSEPARVLALLARIYAEPMRSAA